MGAQEKKRARLSIMYEKQKELAMMSENRPKIYIVEIKVVNLVFAGQGHEKKRELKNEADIL